MVIREAFNELYQRIENEPRGHIQVLYGPRQTGKTTAARQVAKKTSLPVHIETADAIDPDSKDWISNQWQTARLQLTIKDAKSAVLILDEIQKINNWSEQVKREWDADTANGIALKVVLLGSSRLMLQQGLTESLTGRFESIYVPHWSFSEMQELHDLSLNEYIFYGGYPSSAEYRNNWKRWKRYINSSFIQTSIEKDILMLTRVDKPALLAKLFKIGSNFTGQVLSFNKIKGQLQDVGNVTTLSDYLTLLDTAGLLAGLEKFTPNQVRKYSSSPKFQVQNNALLSAQQNLDMNAAIMKPVEWGRWVESAVGTHLYNASIEGDFEISYWRERNDEVDFVLHDTHHVLGIEVKSGGEGYTKGMEKFTQKFPGARTLLVGHNGFSLEDFLKTDPQKLLDNAGGKMK
ncbi:MAG: ATP-binding protein [Nonlabens sp.]